MQLKKRTTTLLAKTAISHFWQVREAQAARQEASGKIDQGSRGAATGGAQMDGFVDAFRKLAAMAGIPQEAVFTTSRFLELPGYFRPTKEWDLLIVLDGVLLAVIEAKSQVGPSFGNNFNNRTEEAMGSAVDLWTAFREKAFKRAIRPWLGYLFLLEDCPQSQRPVSVREPHFEVFPEYRDASYAKRYEIFCSKLVIERHYDATALLMSKRADGALGRYAEPCQDIGFHHFAVSLVSHLEGYAS
ncbi:MAG TPA: PaeR7I family type II restriction endonuclease [Candidatus Hydrogenedentes bacterium]|mgnify:CR=1 FL=1|nr:PaeR7I family type II restriction endonuclease [Candidatus Hydrogenedentota bacterium]HPG67230.1 PaeR7I family type II restriction endonuclease [Candidatus Hydrogenedentota bacterium]